MRAMLRTAGERVELRCADGWLAAILADGAAGECVPPDGDPPDVRLTVGDDAAAFDVTGWPVLTRGAWARDGQVIVRNACSSGLDLRVAVDRTVLDVTARWRPTWAVRAASAALRARARLLLRAVLLQYPALWRSGQRGRVPLHASVHTVGGPDGPVVLLAGPGGVGKTTLVTAALGRGAVATSDNLCVTDGHTTWGLAEPLRVPGDGPATGMHSGRGRRMPHGRREAAWPSRARQLTPGHLVVLARGDGPGPAVTPCTPEEAARFLVAGTYMAGELRRYWGFAATLALGTGAGPPHPPIEQAAAALAGRLPCHKVLLGARPGREHLDGDPADGAGAALHALLGAAGERTLAQPMAADTEVLL